MEGSGDDDVQQQNIDATTPCPEPPTSQGDAGGISILREGPFTLSAPTSAAVTHVPSVEDALTAADVSQLKEDQRRAFYLLMDHVDNEIAGVKQAPLRMIWYGEAGQGNLRSRRQTVTEALEARGVAQRLLKAAYTGVAAFLIDGKTTLDRSHIPKRP